jgi:hypothetical protein
VYVPALPAHERVEALKILKVALVGLKLQVKPVEGNTEDASVTVPVRPCSAGRAVIVTVDVPATPELTVTLVMLAPSVKSWTT